MTEQLLIIGVSFGGGLVAGLILMIFMIKKQGIDIEKGKQKAHEMVAKSQQEAVTIKTDIEEKIRKIQENQKEAEKTFKEFLAKIEEVIQMKEENLKRKELKIAEIQKVLNQEQKNGEDLKNQKQELEAQIQDSLTRKVGEKKEELQKKFFQNLEKELRETNEIRLAHLEEFYSENAEAEAKNIILNALQRLSSPTSNEKKGTQVTVPKDSMKIKLVGKNAQNIKKLEEALEVDVIFNDFPNTITISHYNILTRHIAKKTIEKIFNETKDVTPEMVMDKIEQAKKDTDRELLSIGKEAIRRMNIKRQFPEELYQVVGRLQFRTSYGQNIMRHSFEVGLLALMMGYELGLEMETCKVGGFLHDLGKAIDQNPDIIGAHDYLTKELMEKFKFPEKEIHAAWTHHDSEPPKTPEAFVIKGADAISAGRPGARQEALDKYIERMNQLNEIANSYEGVQKVQIMSAGREVRVYVNPQELGDDLLEPLAQNIAKEVKEGVAYPGYVKINTIRRTQTTENTSAGGAKK